MTGSPSPSPSAPPGPYVPMIKMTTYRGHIKRQFIGELLAEAEPGRSEKGWGGVSRRKRHTRAEGERD